MDTFIAPKKIQNVQLIDAIAADLLAQFREREKLRKAKCATPFGKESARELAVSLIELFPEATIDTIIRQQVTP